jgi:hypothetical protein
MPPAPPPTPPASAPASPARVHLSGATGAPRVGPTGGGEAGGVAEAAGHGGHGDAQRHPPGQWRRLPQARQTGETGRRDRQARQAGETGRRDRQARQAGETGRRDREARQAPCQDTPRRHRIRVPGLPQTSEADAPADTLSSVRQAAAACPGGGTLRRAGGLGVPRRDARDPLFSSSVSVEVPARCARYGEA